MRIINTVTNDTIAEIITNRSMTVEEALDLVGTRVERVYDDDPDYVVDGREVWVEECDIQY